MTREQILEHALEELVEHVKALHSTLASVMVETAALRNTILTESADWKIYAGSVKSGAQIAKPLLDTAIQSYNAIIQQLRTCEGTGDVSPEAQSSKTTLLQ